ncbi:tetratricopeptide repeat protein [Alkalicoccus chagannorensis]|uniref:tetratricopeptide repeat protein n=1 Tax=Alkalicoccus chagannorensis TaxID=427072 RepID=UPI00040872DD|nr:tetratricopeptide repeat protein [Alkalicoccus chagannorensis]
MREELTCALDLRKKGALEASSEMLENLVHEFPEDAEIHYQAAWSYDLLGEEAKAVPHYEKAIASTALLSEERAGAFIGLGSTYRTLGEYEKSRHTLLKGLALFPENRAMQTFYAMTLYNLEAHQEAMEYLLTCLIDTTQDADILRYQQAITFYADQLDKVWE